MQKNFSREDKIFLIIFGVLISLLVISNVVAVKIVKIGGFIGPAGLIAYSLIYLLTDTVVEIWGNERAKFLVTVGFIASIITAFCINFSLMVPAASSWEYQQEFKLILGSNFRIVIASMLAYLISQYYDIWIYKTLKKATDGKYLWLRNNLSTMTSQLIDTVVFIIIAFINTGNPLFSIIVGQYIFKLIVALVDTPLIYLMVKMIRVYVLEESEEVSVLVETGK